MPSLSFASSGSQYEPQITLITFQPAPRNSDSSSWMILPLPRTGPSSRCRLQLTTQIRLSSRSRPAPPDPGFDLLDVLAVAATRSVEPLQVAVDDPDQVVEPVAAREARRAQ